MGCNDDLRCKSLEPPMSALGHSRPGPAGRRSSHVRYAPKATVGHQNAIGRDGPTAEVEPACPSGLLCSRMAHLGEEEFGLAVRHQGYPHCRCRYPHHG
jgi:hypothetical protein